MDVAVFGLRKSSMNTNLVDVIVPSFNNDKYLTDAISSVLIQTEYVNKILVVDDGSTDNTKKIVTTLATKTPKLQYIHQVNAGLSSARNTGIKHSTSKYLAFLDADDVWLPGKLESQINKFETTKYKNLGLVYGEYLDVDEAGKEIQNFGGFRLHKDIKGDVSKQLLECNYATGSGSAVLVKRECFDRVGMFDETLKACEDWDMWMRIAQKYSFEYVDAPLVKLRRHQNSMQANRRHMITNQVKLMNKMKQANLAVPVTMNRSIRKDVLGLIISNPFNPQPYSLLRYIRDSNQSAGQGAREFLFDLVWAMYASIPFLSRIASNKSVRKLVIDPINKYVKVG